MVEARILTMARRRFALILAMLAVATVGGVAGKAAMTQPTAAIVTNSCGDHGYTGDHGYAGGHEDQDEKADAQRENRLEATQHLTTAQDRAEDKKELQRQRQEDQREKTCDRQDSDAGDGSNGQGD
jgi:basic membrane lipoprotein Med (substrate-binding protein (PBP1-ABC) superfamily)